MRNIRNKAFNYIVYILSAAALLSLAFVVFFVAKEAMPAFAEQGVSEILFGTRWMPIAYVGEASFGIFNFIMGTLAVSLVAMVIATVLGLGAAMFLASLKTDRVRSMIIPFVDLLAGIPSVVYGFVGLMVLKPLFIKAGVSTGLCVLAAAIVLAVMLLPYLVSSCTETMIKIKEKNLSSARALGVSDWYLMATIVLPASMKNVLISMALAVGRAMGETMAVMMVMGNANVFPTLLGKGETIASLIALEMGTAVDGSTHYHSLYAAGFVLLVLLIVINIAIACLRKKLIRRDR